MSKGLIVRNPNVILVPWYIKIFSRIHFTYLLIEGYYKFLATYNLQLENFSQKLQSKFSKKNLYDQNDTTMNTLTLF